MHTFYKIVLLLLSVSCCFGQEGTDWTSYIELYNEKNINTEGTEFAPAYWNENVVFAKSRSRQKILDRNTNEPYYDLFISGKNKVGSLLKAEPLSPKINSDYHEGPATFQNSSCLFTRVDYNKGEFTLDSDKKVALKIFEAQFENGSLDRIQKSPLNEENVASAHPALSPKGDYIIFASDRPGGYGKMDLYISYKENNSWGSPTNLGPEINTAGNEWFPFVNERDYLFYSSDGYEKGKDLDIYIIEKYDDSWSTPLKLPAPINSDYDDFAFITDKTATNGYLSTNRPGGQGKDDIYSYNSLVTLYAYDNSNYNKLRISVVDYNSGTSLSDAVIKYKYLEEKAFESFDQGIFKLNNSDGVDSTYSNSNGIAKIDLGEGYTLVEVSYPNKENWQLVLSNHGAKKNLDVQLKDAKPTEKSATEIIYIERPVEKETVIKNVKVDVGAVIVFDNIYYDYNSFVLTTGAKKELDALAEVMRTNSNLKIQLGAHTDSRGDAEYNLELSNKRVQSAKDYLVSRGISSSNIRAVGYGESQLRNHCKDDIYCTEAEHIYNRRTEVKILQK